MSEQDKIEAVVLHHLKVSHGGTDATLDSLACEILALRKRVAELEQDERDHHEFYCLGVSDDS